MNTILRVAFVYLFLLAALRMLGKRELSKLSPVELVTLLLIPELFQQALVGDDYSLTTAVVATGTLLALVFLTSLLTHRFPGLHSVVSGKPTVLAHRGKLLVDNMNRERIAPDELLSEMHKAGIERLDQVRWAILGSDGKIALIREDEEEVEQDESDDVT